MVPPKNPIKYQEWKRRLSKTFFKKGQIPWNKGKKGIMPIPWNKGLTKEDEPSLSNSGRKEGGIPWNKGVPCSKEIREQLSKICFKKGHIPWNKGKNLLEETKKKISESKKRNYIKEKHSMFGKKHKKESIEKMSKTKLRIYQNKENHPCWLGGKSFELYGLDFNQTFKRMIKKRDDYACQLCNLIETDSLLLYKRGLLIHHVDYIKKNSFPQNCISLCVKCNSLVNGNRNHWKTFFQSLLKERYDYEYTEDQKIILDFTKVNENGV